MGISNKMRDLLQFKDIRIIDFSLKKQILIPKKEPKFAHYIEIFNFNELQFDLLYIRTVILFYCYLFVHLTFH